MTKPMKLLPCGPGLTLSLALTVLSAARFAVADPPYPPSRFITGVDFDWSTHRRMAPGSDNWPITWSDDDHQYAAWGDGGGFGGTNSDGRVSLGFARVEGTGDRYTGHNVWGGKDAGNPATFGGKSYGIISIDGVLYAWVGPGSNTTSYSEARLYRSADKGAAWEGASWAFVRSQRLIMPTILNFGRDFAGARDDYVYHYFIRLQGNPSGLEVHVPGMIDLARAPKDRLFTREAYEFFAGLDDDGRPVWTDDADSRRPVFEDPAGVGWTASVSFNAGLGRYLLCTEHERTTAGNLGIFDAPTPWGPRTTVHYTESFGAGSVDTSTFFWNFSNKWSSADGRVFVLVFTGVGSNDSWNTVEGTFSFAPEYPASTAVTDIRFDWSTHRRFAPGSDNWPITWAGDDHQYTAWGDGGGFGGTNSNGRVSNGFGRIEGPASDYAGVNIAGGFEAPHPAPFSGKCHGLVSIGGVLYAWRDGNGSGASAYDFTELWKSTDRAATWSFTGVRFRPSDFAPPRDRGFFNTHFLQFGRDYAGARDTYFYLYATNTKRSDWQVQYPGEIILMRVPVGEVEDRSAYEYFAGLDESDGPTWTDDRLARQPVWRDARNGVHRVTVSYNAPLRRYFLWTEHTARNSGNTAIYEAPEPWGTWSTVLFDFDFASEVTSGKGVIFLSFSNKWLGTDGLDFVSVLSIDDAFDTVEGEFTFTGAPGDADRDGDGVRDSSDNCPDTANPEQEDADGDGLGDACEETSGLQLPGDCNQDGSLDISDGICLLGNLFLGDPASLPCGDGRSAPGNLDLLDSNEDGSIDLSDAVAVFGFLFLGLPLPFLSGGCAPMGACPANSGCG